MIAGLSWLLLACGPPASPPEAIRLGIPPASLSLPEASRPAPAPRLVALDGPFTSRPGPGGLVLWSAPLPLPLALASRSPGGAVRGLKVAGPSGGLRFSPPPVANTWILEADQLVLRLPAGVDPGGGGFTVRHEPSRLAEDRLSFRDAGLSAEDFVFRTATRGAETVQGVYLPAPAEIQWSVAAPAGASLELTAELLPTAIQDGLASDGASLEVSWDGRVLDTIAIKPGAAVPVSVPVPAGAGSLGLRTLPGADTALDHVFVHHPTILRPGRAARRLVVVFVDTLRADHLGAYGYGRQTSPVLDALAAEGARFTQARSVAPWTVPSAQAALSGRQPESWGAGPTLAEHLSAAGWQTIGLVANAYLAPQTGLARGFDQYRLDTTASADQQVTEALARLAASPDRDVALMVHLMDPHLPYTEPESERDRWAGAPPAGLPPIFTRERLTRVRPGQPGFDAVRTYVTARYDQNIRAVDTAIGRLMEAVGDDAVVVVFSDHGEELWEHGGVEHGHALYDELLRVPLIIRAPGVAAGTVVDAPVSLLDVTPTVLSALGLPVPEGPGRDLLPAVHGEAGAAAALAARPQAFGRLLYGRDQWGALQGQTKHIRADGRVMDFDLSTDPTERVPSDGSAEALMALLVEAGLPAVPVWRLGNRARTRAAARGETLHLSVPGGFAAAWGPYDPNSQLSPPQLQEDGTVIVSASGGQRRPAEVYLVPRKASARGFTVKVDGVKMRGRSAEGALWAGDRLRLVEDVSVPISTAFSLGPDVEAALREIGYLTDPL